jgi:hypothetical protein
VVKKNPNFSILRAKNCPKGQNVQVRPRNEHFDSGGNPRLYPNAKETSFILGYW